MLCRCLEGLSSLFINIIDMDGPQLKHLAFIHKQNYNVAAMILNSISHSPIFILLFLCFRTLHVATKFLHVETYLICVATEPHVKTYLDFSLI